MIGRSYFSWRMVAEASEADRRSMEQKELRDRRRLLSDVSRINDTQFVLRYRLSKDAFFYLCDILRNLTNLSSSQRISLENKVLTALLFYAQGDYQRVVGLANYLSQETVSLYIDEVTEALSSPNIVRHFINFPTTVALRNIIKQRFYSLYGIPGVVGCIDGCHFKIFKPPKDEEHLYYCRKHFHSLNVQMIADCNCKIMAINAKFGGASHDSFVWENSQINTYMQTLHQGGESVWLLGDSGYPLRPWLMTPYANPEPGSSSDHYNTAHCRARVLIENTFGRLKNRWRCLCKDRVLHYKPTKCAKIILACSVLHNIATDFRMLEPPGDEITNHGDPVYGDEQEITQRGEEDQSLLLLGRLTRDRVASRIRF